MQIFLTTNNKTAEITKLLDTITWQGDVNSVSRTLQFSLLSNSEETAIPAVNCELGNLVQMYEEKNQLFYGYAFNRQKSSGSSKIPIIWYDQGIYLKKNEAVYRFSGETAEGITAKVAADFGIEIGSLAVTGVTINRIFVGISLYNIIQTAYTLASYENGKAYQIRFEGLKLSVIEKGISADTLIIEPKANLIDTSTTESIDEMINRIVIYDSDNNLLQVKEDLDAIALYGVMQSYLRQDDGDDISSKADKILLDQSVQQKITVNNLGDIRCITGNSVILREPVTKLYGLFYIDSDIHSWKKGIYTNRLTLNFKAIMDEKEVGSLPTVAVSTSTSATATSGFYINKPGE